MTQAGDELERRVQAVLAGLPAHAGASRTLQDLVALGPRGAVLDAVRRAAADHDDARVRFHGERILRVAERTQAPLDLGSPPDPMQLVEALSSDDADHRLAGVRAAARSKDPASLMSLRSALARPDEDGWVLASVLGALGARGEAADAEAVASFLDHPSPRVASNALMALRRLDPAAARPAARARRGAGDHRTRATAMVVLADEDPASTWREVRGLLTSADPWDRASGVWAATCLGGKEAERELVDALVVERDMEIVVRILAWLARFGGVAAVGGLAFFARTGSGPVAEVARRGLEAVRGKVRLRDAEVQRRAEDFEEVRRERVQAAPTPGVEVSQVSMAPRLQARAQGAAEDQEGARLRLLAGALGLGLVGLGVWTWMGSSGRRMGDFGAAAPGPSGVPRPGREAPQAAVRRPVIDITEAEPGAWEGRLESTSAKRVVLELPSGERRVFILKRALTSIPAKGSEVRLEGPLLRKGRRSSTLGAGARLVLR